MYLFFNNSIVHFIADQRVSCPVIHLNAAKLLYAGAKR